MELPIKIRQARAKLNLTAKQAAERWSINPRTLEDYEQGRRKPRGFALKALNDLLDPILAANTPGSASSAATEDSASPPLAAKPPKALRRRLRQSAAPHSRPRGSRAR